MKENSLKTSVSTTEDMKGAGYCTDDNCNYVTDTKGDPSNKYNMVVNATNSANVDESNADKLNDYTAFVVNMLMTNFVNGVGPENYIFPTNGVISKQFLQSSILKGALADYYA